MTLFDTAAPALPTVRPGRKLSGRLIDIRIGDLPGFATRSVPLARLTLEGMEGDAHAGFTREAGGREPWYGRGTEIRSGRQLTIVAEEELAEIGLALDLPQVDPGALGANLVIAGVPRASFLPAGTRLFFDGAASVVIEAQNAPCRHAGRALAEATGRPELEFAFVAAAARRRGVVASVERPGEIRPGTTLSLKIPEQWVYS